MSFIKQKLILIGNGMAGVRFLEHLLQQDNDIYDVTVFGSEPHGGYNRIMLSPLLSGEKDLTEIITHPLDWYQDNNIELIAGKTITEINSENQSVTDHENRSYRYDKLVIATGSNPFIPPIPGHDLPGVLTYRTIEDVDAMMAMTKNKANAIVIGGGLLGLEAAYGLKQQGMNVTVLHLGPVIMENQLDAVASDKLIASLQEKGIDILTDANTKSIDGIDHVSSLTLQDGRVLDAELVVMTVGIRPNISLAQDSGLKCERGIIVDDHLQTSDPNIYALGECVQHQGTCYGLVAPLYEQAEICANHLCGDQSLKYQGSVISTGLKVTGIQLFSAGQFMEDEDCKVIRLNDEYKGIYRKLVFRENRLIGALLYGDMTASLWYRELIETEQDITPYKSFIMFGPDYILDQSNDNSQSVAA